MLVFNHDYDCFCTGEHAPCCALRPECLLQHIENNFKDAKHIRPEIELVKKSLKEGISRESLDRSIIYDPLETTRLFKKF